MMTIRDMTECDAPAVSRIVSECYRLIARPDGLSDVQLNAMLEERCRPEHMLALYSRFHCFVAEMQETLAGLIAVGGDNIEELFVDPSCHRRGIGKALFKHAEQRVRTDGHRKMTVSTTGYGRPFYEAMGMRVCGTRRVTFGPLQGRDLVVLEKRTCPNAMDPPPYIHHVKKTTGETTPDGNLIFLHGHQPHSVSSAQDTP